MQSDPLKQIEQQLTERESKMLSETKKRLPLLKNIHPSQQFAARNMIQYLTFRNEDIREVQNIFHMQGLSSLASSESHIHRQLQFILRRLGKHYTVKELDSYTYGYNQLQMVNK